MTRSRFRGVLGPGPSYYLVSRFHLQWRPDSVAQRYRAVKTRADSSTSKAKRWDQEFVLHCKSICIDT